MTIRDFELGWTETFEVQVFKPINSPDAFEDFKGTHRGQRGHYWRSLSYSNIGVNSRSVDIEKSS